MKEKQASSTSMATPQFSFGLVADIQFSETEDIVAPTRSKFYRAAMSKFKTCVDTWNEHSLAFAVRCVSVELILQNSLGDIIDGDNGREGKGKDELRRILEVSTASKAKVHHVPGTFQVSVQQ